MQTRIFVSSARIALDRMNVVSLSFPEDPAVGRKLRMNFRFPESFPFDQTEIPSRVDRGNGIDKSISSIEIDSRARTTGGDH